MPGQRSLPLSVHNQSVTTFTNTDVQHEPLMFLPSMKEGIGSLLFFLQRVSPNDRRNRCAIVPWIVRPALVHGDVVPEHRVSLCFFFWLARLGR